ncbi:hypothetical protein [Lactococcus garvieae]|nr:hypothetical protein [Lactococcus garvieae]
MIFLAPVILVGSIFAILLLAGCIDWWLAAFGLVPDGSMTVYVVTVAIIVVIVIALIVYSITHDYLIEKERNQHF